MSLGLYWILVSLIYNSIDSTEGRGRIIHGKFFGTLSNKTLPFHTKESKNVQNFWINQPLDHENLKDNRTWNQRYFKNDTFYQSGGPIFINIGGEGPADPYWVLRGEMMDHCSKLQGISYLLEHRFYGQSHPLPDASVKSLKYLSIAQALADLENFIIYVKSTDDLKANKVVLYGGSYAGTLSAYFAQKYPEVAYISVASSAPINWIYDFERKRNYLAYLEYLEVVGRVVKGTSAKSYNTIKSGMHQLEQTVRSMRLCNQGQQSHCKANLNALKLCRPLDPNNVLDVQNINQAISGLFAYFVQYNGLMKPGVEELCSYLDNYQNNATDFEKLASVVNIVNLEFESDCLDYSNQLYCDYIAAETWEDDSVKSGARTWTWQVCNEVGSMQTTKSTNQPFGRNIPSSFFAQQCQCAFGKKYTESFIRSNVHRHMAIYGSSSECRLRTVYINGKSDPWAALGITHSNQLPTPNSNPVILIKGASHCNDLAAAKANDSIPLTDARSQTFNHIKSLIQSDNHSKDESCSHI